jgi:predicted N-formylglutamate amidohydrolase
MTSAPPAWRERMAEALDAPVILSDFSRLVIDPNRGEDDPTLLMKVYDGSIIPANRHADAAEVERRLRAITAPITAPSRG